MVRKYLIDTCIWLDIIEDRKGYMGEPLGDYAAKFFLKITLIKEKIIISNFLIQELKRKISDNAINSMFKPYENMIERVFSTKNQLEEAKKLGIERLIPRGDALHAIMARDENAILITRDKDFDKLLDITTYYKPEDFI